MPTFDLLSLVKYMYTHNLPVSRSRSTVSIDAISLSQFSFFGTHVLVGLVSSGSNSSSVPFVCFDLFGAGESEAALSCDEDLRFPSLEGG